MTTEEWDRIKEIFEAALNLPEEDRSEYLRAASKDQNVHRMVIELVQNHQSVMEASRRLRGNSDTDPVLTAGELIAGRFRILRFIAGGGMGEVYEANDERLKVRIAVKTLRPALLDDTGALELFKREIVIARYVSHDNICRVFDLIEHHSASRSIDVATGVIPCLTMELLEGESLADLIRRERPLSATDALPLVIQIAKGLEILHDHGVIHRDLKPSNVMLVPRRSGGIRAVVMDFGLAKMKDADGKLFESNTDLQAGAPYFMAPELLRNKKPSVSSDIYSLGLVIDELITRDRAFSSSSLQELYFSKLWEKPVRPELRSDDLPTHWAQTITRCLQTDPLARYASVREVLRDLECGQLTSLPFPDETSHASAPPRAISRRAIILGAAAIPIIGWSAAVAAMAFEHVQSTVEVFDIDNITSTKDYDYFCKGITNELMRSLLHLDGVHVMPVYATRSNSPLKRLGRFSLDGLFEAQDGRIRLSMRLTDNRDGRLVWSESYDRQALSSPMEMETDIAHGAVLALEQQVLSHGDTFSSRGILAFAVMPLRRAFAVQSSAALPNAPTSSNEAFDLYMRGHSLIEELSPRSVELAAEYFRRAITVDPHFALAYSALADAQISSMNYDVAPNPDTIKTARSYAEEAVRQDPKLAEAHMVSGALRQIDWDWDGADSSYREALNLKPNLARARRWYAGLILQFRRFDEAIAESKRAMEQDPYDRSAPTSLGFVLTMARRFDEAEDILLRSLAAKDMVLTRLNLAQLYAWLGHINGGSKSATYFAGAFAQVNVALQLMRSNASDQLQQPITDAMFALFHTMIGEEASARPYLDKSLAAIDAGHLSTVMVAKVYAAAGDFGNASNMLDQAAYWHDRRLLYIHIDPFFESMNGQPGYKRLLNRMKL